MLGRIYEDLLFDGEDICGYRIYVAYLLYFIAEEFNANRKGFVRRIQLDDVAADSECSSLKVDVVPGVLDVC